MPTVCLPRDKYTGDPFLVRNLIKLFCETAVIRSGNVTDIREYKVGGYLEEVEGTTGIFANTLTPGNSCEVCFYHDFLVALFDMCPDFVVRTSSKDFIGRVGFYSAHAVRDKRRVR